MFRYQLKMASLLQTCSKRKQQYANTCYHHLVTQLIKLKAIQRVCSFIMSRISINCIHFEWPWKCFYFKRPLKVRCYWPYLPPKRLPPSTPPAPSSGRFLRRARFCICALASCFDLFSLKALISSILSFCRFSLFSTTLRRSSTSENRELPRLYTGLVTNSILFCLSQSNKAKRSAKHQAFDNANLLLFTFEKA